MSGMGLGQWLGSLCRKGQGLGGPLQSGTTARGVPVW